ncbi:unnamed protein product [marine sediment metagenome]|uniref:Uncharacterized protein n=1 Tax=marine sediment metagenome TaxID=412755 RepID=X1F2I1_9ZZZZ
MLAQEETNEIGYLDKTYVLGIRKVWHIYYLVEPVLLSITAVIRICPIERVSYDLSEGISLR